MLPEPFASDAELSYGAVPLTDLDQGATTSFPVQGYVVTKQWAEEYPNTLAAFYKALEEGQETGGHQPLRRGEGHGGHALTAGPDAARPRRSWRWMSTR